VSVLATDVDDGLLDADPPSRVEFLEEREGVVRVAIAGSAADHLERMMNPSRDHPLM